MKYYTVWKGVNPGVYDSWTDCQLQIKGFKGALYKSFNTRKRRKRRKKTGSKSAREFQLRVYSC